MTGFLLFLHAIICVLLVVVILMQSGRGGGLTESFQAAESIFGAQTSSFMIKATTVLTILFLLLSTSLAVISSRKGKSIMPQKIVLPDAQPMMPQADSEPIIPKSNEASTQAPVSTPQQAPAEPKL